jgi:carbamoyltransferase
MKAVVGVQVGITSGCAVYRNGRVEFAASEERYSRVKNDTSFPEAAITDAIQRCALAPESIERVVLVSTKMTPEHFLVRRESTFGVEDYLREQREYYHPRLFGGKQLDYLDVFADKIDERYIDLLNDIRVAGVSRAAVWNRWRTDKICKTLGVDQSLVTIVNHEQAHAAYAYYGSPFRGEDVLVCTFDGYGDDANAAIASHQNGRLNIDRRYKNFNVGRVYRYMTLLLGMKPSEHEYKVMGLAPYATEYTYGKALEVFKKAYRFTESGDVEVAADLKDNFYYFKERLEACRFDGIAAGLQVFTEQMNCALVAYWLSKLNRKRVVLSGGVSLNIKANMEVGKLPGVDDLFVVGSGGDESLCIAGIFAYLDSAGRGEEIVPLESLYLGTDSDAREVETAVKRLASSMDVEVWPDASPDQVAKQLETGRIVGRVQGRMEFGARALGNRSILADPRSGAVIRKINSQIKNRDFWMPFTPSMLPSASVRYLRNPKGFRYPHMSVACATTPEGQAALPGALHPGDLTARPHVVEKHINPEYFALLSAFERVTGVGALLNTSLNLHGFPIVRTAADAAHVFENSDLDGLLLDRTLIVRK